jgi:hypothetical protein
MGTDIVTKQRSRHFLLCQKLKSMEMQINCHRISVGSFHARSEDGGSMLLRKAGSLPAYKTQNNVLRNANVTCPLTTVQNVGTLFGHWALTSSQQWIATPQASVRLDRVPLQ